ncbi:MAG TPA: late promoter transcription accessory protein [Rhabdochlamydiaceae bacterium]
MAISEISRNEFSLAVEKKACSENISILTAMVNVMEECHIEEKHIAKYVNKSLKDKIQAEALDLRLIKGNIRGEKKVL